METKELLKKVRKIEIKTRGLSSQIFSGEYHSAFKGSGMAFSEVREYTQGDEIRAIDWNVTARTGKTHIKVFEEERELTVMLLVDVSGSGKFGTNQQLKQEIITEICAVIAFSAIQNNDKIGVIFFSDKIEKFIPPKKGKAHTLRIIRELIDFTPENKGTNIEEGLRYLVSVIRKRCIAFVISDFMDEGFENVLKIAGKKHDLIALKINDQAELSFPDLGLIQLQDLESGKTNWVDTSDRNFQSDFRKQIAKRETTTKNIFRRSGVDFTTLETGHNYVKPLMALFKKRSSRR